MITTAQQHDLLVQQLAVIERRINWSLDRGDKRGFVVSCQHRKQVKNRLVELAYELAAEEDEVEAA